MAKLTEEDYRMQCLALAKDHWFQNHEAHWLQLEAPTLTGEVNRLHILEWRQAGTGNYAVRYLLDGGALSVTGDLGCALYRFRPPLTWADLRQYDHHYFAANCDASEVGRGFRHHRVDLKLRGVIHNRCLGHWMGLQMACALTWGGKVRTV